MSLLAVAPAPDGGDNDGQASMAAMAMSVSCDLPMEQRVAVERALTLLLQEVVTPAQRRVAELGGLANLLAEHGEEFDDPDVLRQLRSELWQLERHRRRLPADERYLVDEEIRSLRKRAKPRVGVPVISEELYERLRPAGSPSAETLARRYGGWLKACRAAYGLQPDGSTTGPGRPWAVPLHGARGVPLYSQAGCLDAVRRCAQALLRVPTTEDYRSWQRAQRVRQPGRMPADLCLPDVGTVIDRFGSWVAVTEALAISAHELAELRAAGVPNEAGDAAHEEARRHQILGGRKPSTLPLADAIALAAAHDVSLEWLAGDDGSTAPSPSPHAALSGEAVKARRSEVKVRDDALARAAKLTTGQWRQVLAGRRELTLGQMVAVAALLRCSCADPLSDGEVPDA